MIFSKFIAKSEKYNTIDDHENAPLFIKKFHYEKGEAKLRIYVAGLYRLYINGADITKGYFAPYISNPDHVLFYDEYAITDRLIAGENEIRIILGNSFANCRDNGIWDFERAARSPVFFRYTLYSVVRRVRFCKIHKLQRNNK